MALKVIILFALVMVTIAALPAIREKHKYPSAARGISANERCGCDQGSAQKEDGDKGSQGGKEDEGADGEKEGQESEGEQQQEGTEESQPKSNEDKRFKGASKDLLHPHVKHHVPKVKLHGRATSNHHQEQYHENAKAHRNELGKHYQAHGQNKNHGVHEDKHQHST